MNICYNIVSVCGMSMMPCRGVRVLMQHVRFALMPVYAVRVCAMMFLQKKTADNLAVSEFCIHTIIP